MSTQGQRLKKIRQSLGLSQEEFGKKIGVSKQYVSNLEADRNILNNEKLVSLLVDFCVSSDFILSGKGLMFLNDCENTHALIKNEKALLNLKNWGKRLGQILSENEETPYGFAIRTGIKESRIEKFILNSDEPTLDEVNAIKCNVDVSIDELLYGETVEKNTQAGNNISLSIDEILKIKQLLNKSND